MAWDVGDLTVTGHALGQDFADLTITGHSLGMDLADMTLAIGHPKRIQRKGQVHHIDRERRLDRTAWL